MTTTPGWYDDGHGALRWWDGAGWTEPVATPDAEPESGADDAGEGETAVLPPMTSYPGDYPGAAYPGAAYPGATYPGAETGGAFVSATEPRKSRLWIVWVVLGVVLLGFVVALAVLVPMLFLSLTPGASSQSPEATGITAADEQAAVDAVELYDQALQTIDCDAYFASTTESFRELFEITDCDTFVQRANDFAVVYQDYDVAVTAVEGTADSISVYTTETYVSPYDADGNETDEPQAYEDAYEYIVVPVDGGWAVDDAFLL